MQEIYQHLHRLWTILILDLYKEDITNREAVYKLFEEEKPDMVVNFAAESHVDRSIEDPEVFLTHKYHGYCRTHGCVPQIRYQEIPSGINR